jgi:transposase-like protein
MKGHSGKLSRKQEQAIAALLEQPTLEAAARAIGVADVTLWRWMKQPEFANEYRTARRQVLETALAQLQQTARAAAEALRRNLTCGNPSVEVRAALGVLEQAVKAAEWLDVEERLAQLEAQLAGEQEVRCA